MVCSQCGAYSEANVKYCAVCGAPMPADGYYEERPPSQAHDDSGERPGWGFVQSPKWPKPEFIVDKADELAKQEIREAPRPGWNGQYGAQAAGYQGSEQQTGEYRTVTTRAAVSPNNYAEPSDYRDRGYIRSDLTEQSGWQPPVRRPKVEEGIRRASAPDYADDRNDYYTAVPGADTFEDRETVVPRAADGYDDDFDDEDEFEENGRVRFPMNKKSDFGSPKKSILQKQGSVRGARKGGSSLRRGPISPVIIVAGAAVVVVGLLVFGITRLAKSYGSLGGFFTSVFGGTPITKPAEITEGLDDSGVECYIITVYAREGNVVTARAGDDEISGAITSSGYKIIRIPKNRFLAEEPVEGDVVELKADVSITTTDGEVIQVDIPAVQVTVPTIVFEIHEPSGSPAYVNRSKVAVSGKVSDGDVGVTIEGQPLAVDGDGNFSGEYVLPGMGVYTLNLEAKKNGYRIERKTVQVDYSVASAEIDLDKASLRTPTNSNKTTVKGTLTPGATLSITPPAGVTADSPSVDASTGAFSFSVEIDSEGSYVIDCLVTKDGLSTKGEIIVERPPVLDTYSSACQKIDYTRMTTEPSHNAKYLCSGKVVEILQNDPYIIAKLTTDVGDILFEYHGTAASVEAGDGRTYNVYADYKGIDSDTGLPHVYGWFIIKPSR